MTRKSLLIAGLLSFSLVAFAGEDLKSLSLKEAQEIAIKNHPRITAAELKALASKQVVREVRSGFFPTVTANVTAVGTTEDNTRIAAGGLNNPLILNRNAEGINVTQLITDFGRTANLVASSKLHARAEEESSLATRAQIMFQVDAAYFNALQAQSVLQVARQTVETRRLLFDLVNEMATNNLKSGLDVSFAKVSLEEGNLLLSKANNELQSAFANLSILLGHREQQNFQLIEESIVPNPKVDTSLLVEEALRNRPELARLRFETEAAGKQVKAEKALHYPTISAIGSAGIIPIHDPQLKGDYAAAGVNLSIPIFDGMLFSAREKEARLKAKAIEENLRDEENNVIRDVRVAGLNLNFAGERVTLTAKLLESAAEAFDLAQARYKVGSSSIVELSQAQLSKTQAEIAQANAKFDYHLQKAILDYQTGQLR
ncbi:MAG: Outer rane efflux protein [Pedosphaera sp.]|nr:Outer rane efflux protein [Pedosphaera sp.]